VAHLSVTQALAGFFAAIGLYNTLIYFVTSDRAFLWYAVLMDTIAGVQFVFAPHLIGVAGGDSLVMYRMLIFGLFFCAEVIFAWTFLRIPIRFPRFAQAIAILLAANLLALGLDRLLGPSPAHRALDHVLFLALLATCAAAAWSGMTVGQEDARYYLVAYGGLFVCAGASAACDYFGVPRWPVYFFQLGALWQAALLTLALASRYFKLDPLTGVKSRRAFDEGLLRAYRGALRRGGGLAVIVISIHALREYEARFGRMAGDTMMRRVANLCAGCCRDRADVFARYGDEAFAAIIPRVSKSEADAIAQRMRDVVEESCQITIGVGVGSIDEAHSAKGIIQRAAQRSARNAIGRAAIPETAAL
jgi:diguanylate cyclase (GGDEF)-like protein